MRQNATSGKISLYLVKDMCMAEWGRKEIEIAKGNAWP